ncbi:MAG: iron ABC transporter permease [Rhodobacteraceae bacterium]|nr:iron ABC transporter permease [Paracoccaceae bacterium]
MRQPLLLGLLAGLVAALFVASLAVGPAGIGLRGSLAALVAGGDGPAPLILREIRLPRALLGLLIGAGLGLSGAALQGFLRNPLAEPGLIGVSSSAALGAVVAIYSGASAAFALALPVFALAGALLGVLAILALAGAAARTLTLILAGVAVSALAAALTSLVLNLSSNPYAAGEIVFWMMGSLADRSMLHVAIAAPFILAGGIALLTLGRGLDALTLGEDAAASLGIGLAAMRLRLVLGIAAVVGAATAVAGAVGFVGLVVPHLLRSATGARPARLLWASALGGAAVVLAADVATRVIAPERDLKLGVLTALVGAPFFLHLIRKTAREAA